MLPKIVVFVTLMEKKQQQPTNEKNLYCKMYY